MSAPELVHVATMAAQLGSDRFAIPTGPKGGRVVVEVDSITVTGDRLNATMVGKSAADWLTIGPDGTYGTLNVRFTLETDDGAIVYCEYGGKADIVNSGAISAPLFECGDERYDWLNRSQFVGVGTGDRDTNILTYELYEVRPA